MLLTARHLNPAVRTIVSAKLEENVKLFRQGGADAIVSPATFGGYILAAAVDHGHMVDYFNDLLTAGGKVRLIERPGHPNEIGKRPEDLKPEVLLRIYRGTTMIPLFELDQAGYLQEGDIVVLVTAAANSTQKTGLKASAGPSLSLRIPTAGDRHRPSSTRGEFEACDS